MKLPKPSLKLPDLKAVASRAVAKVRDFRLPLDLGTIDRLDREHYRLVIYSLLAVIAAMAFAGVFAFALSLKGTEETMVPDIRGQEQIGRAHV